MLTIQFDSSGSEAVRDALERITLRMAQAALIAYQEHLLQEKYPPHSSPGDDKLHYGTGTGMASLTTEGTTAVLGVVKSEGEGDYILHWAGYPASTAGLTGATEDRQRPWIEGGAPKAAAAMRKEFVIRLD